MAVNYENKVSALDGMHWRRFTEFPSSFLNHGAEIDPFPVATAAEERERGRRRERERAKDVSLVERWKRWRRMQICLILAISNAKAADKSFPPGFPPCCLPLVNDLYRARRHHPCERRPSLPVNHISPGFLHVSAWRTGQGWAAHGMTKAPVSMDGRTSTSSALIPLWLGKNSSSNMHDKLNAKGMMRIWLHRLAVATGR